MQGKGEPSAVLEVGHQRWGEGEGREVLAGRGEAEMSVEMLGWMPF